MIVYCITHRSDCTRGSVLSFVRCVLYVVYCVLFIVLYIESHKGKIARAYGVGDDDDDDDGQGDCHNIESHTAQIATGVVPVKRKFTPARSSTQWSMLSSSKIQFFHLQKRSTMNSTFGTQSAVISVSSLRKKQ